MQVSITGSGAMILESVQGDYEDETTSNDSCGVFDVGFRQFSNVSCDVKREFVCEPNIFIVDF